MKKQNLRAWVVNKSWKSIWVCSAFLRYLAHKELYNAKIKNLGIATIHKI